jgi:hypothetical protein
VLGAEVDQEDIGKISIRGNREAHGLCEAVVSFDHLVAAFTKEDDAGIRQESFGKLLYDRLCNNRTGPGGELPSLAVCKGKNILDSGIKLL